MSVVGASGCIASTAADMNRYVALIARGGKGLLSPDSFALMTKRHIAAAEFGPKGGYGYGWMTDEVDGRKVVRHTGGMASFMSSIHVDPAAGCGAFASINAQQGYRPVPVTAQALRLCRARAAGAPLPKAPPIDADPNAGGVAADYVGDYLRKDGGVARVSAKGRQLTVAIDGNVLVLENLSDDNFVCLDPRYRLFTIVFQRGQPPLEAVDGQPNPVLAVHLGRDSFVRRGEKPPGIAGVEDRRALSPERLLGYEGLYVSNNPWWSAVRVVLRDGRLWIDSPGSVAPLASLGDDRYRFADETASPEVAAFSPDTVSPRSLSIGNVAMLRVGDPFMELA